MPAFALPGSQPSWHDPAALAARLDGFGIRLGTTAAELPPDVAALAGRFGLNPLEQEQLLSALDPLLAQLDLIEPLRRRDLLQLRSRDQRSEEHLVRFGRFHVHDDDEGRYVVSGSCVFGFALPELGQLRLHLGPGDHLRIPAGIEHWFALGELGSLQAVRLFASSTPMVTTDTGRPIRPLGR